MGYDRSKDTTKADVAKEVVEAKVEVGQAVDAVKTVVSGGSLSEALKEVNEAAAAVTEAAVAEVDLLLDSAKRFFKTVRGYRLHNPFQGVAIEPEATAAAHDDWMKTQIDAGLIIEVDKDGNQVSAPTAPPSTQPRDETPAEPAK